MPIDMPLDDIGRTTVVCFACNLNRDGVEMMLELGASLAVGDKIGRTILHYLAQLDETGDLTEWLISQKRSDLNVNA